MTKAIVFNLTNLLHPQIEHLYRQYWLAILPIVCVAYCLFKLIQGATLHICLEVFAIGTSTTLRIIRNVVKVVDDESKHEIYWPTSNNL